MILLELEEIYFAIGSPLLTKWASTSEMEEEPRFCKRFIEDEEGFKGMARMPVPVVRRKRRQVVWKCIAGIISDL